MLGQSTVSRSTFDVDVQHAPINAVTVHLEQEAVAAARFDWLATREVDADKSGRVLLHVNDEGRA